MENKNIILNYNLEKYNKKYRNRVNKLLKYSKKQVEDFDNKYCYYEHNNKKYNLKYNNYYLLKDRKWALIEDTYYEIPKPIRLTWFRNLSIGAQAAICLLGTAAVSSAVVFPTLSVTIWNKGGNIPTPGPEPLKPVDFKTCSWDDVAIRCTKLEDGEISEDEFYNLFTFDGNAISSREDFIGKERVVKVNGQDHRVRVIDVQHGKDEAEAGNKDLIVENEVVTNKVAALTFEFANLISDSNGYSLAYQWIDRLPDDGSPNTKYNDSTIRYALNGQGDNAGKTGTKQGEILVAEKGQTEWSTTYNKTVLSMLPDDLQKTLKTVQKFVGCGFNYESTSYFDKLFMTSGIELGYVTNTDDKGFGSSYSYYKNATTHTDTLRIKKQVNEEIDIPSPIIPDTAGQQSEANVTNRAGVNQTSATGGFCSLRSPSGQSSCSIFYVSPGGKIIKGQTGTGVNNSYNTAYAIAPAFCI